MKKLYITIGVLFVALVIVCKYNIGNSRETTVNEIYQKYLNDVDGAVTYLRESKEFENMNKNVQLEDMGKLLKLYENDGTISNLYYDESSEMYTFLYRYGDIEGTPGGVWLKEWDAMVN